MQDLATMSLGDALQYVNALPEGASKQHYYDVRINPISYFQRAFSHALLLLVAMFDTGCVLSGSHGLEFFVPGSTSPLSDWDFYVPGYKQSVLTMIKTLCICGVTWSFESDRIQAGLQSHGFVHVKATVLRKLASWVEYLPAEIAVDVIGKEAYNTVRAFQSAEKDIHVQIYRVYFGPDGTIQVTPDSEPPSYDQSGKPPIYEESMEREPYEDSQGNHFSILHGQIKTPNGIQNVQLIIGQSFSGVSGCMSFIKSFYASHVQCFVGGWCAGHMYYSLAHSKRGIIWNNQRTAQIKSALEKYESRGYIFEPAGNEDESYVRTFMDDDSMFVDYGHIYRHYIPITGHRLLSSWLDKRRKNIQLMSWNHIHKCVDLSNPMGKFHNLQNRKGLTPLPRGEMCLADLTRQEFGNNMVEEDQEWIVARSGTVWNALPPATLWAWVL
ncbi:hypothetical protein V2G26_017316 [Clonostachys chloroleuca]